MASALILVDVQNDFVPGGALAVEEGDQIIPLVNQLQQKFDLIVATQDWHPADHGSFATNHPDQQPGNVIDLHGLPQILWPVHCVQGEFGAEFVSSLDLSRVAKIFPKGTDVTIDSYSGFFDNGKRKSTGLHEYLQQQGVDAVYVLGLATDYCVKFTALDALELGLTTYLIEDASRGVNLQAGDVQRAVEEMATAGVQVIQSTKVLEQEGTIA
ncbi:MAG: bifunctional nicotinamidase/pyrazinamidase [Bacteroidota bacterium]